MKDDYDKRLLDVIMETSMERYLLCKLQDLQLEIVRLEQALKYSEQERCDLVDVCIKNNIDISEL